MAGGSACRPNQLSQTRQEKFYFFFQKDALVLPLFASKKNKGPSLI
jgi:hypothetical protein